MQFSTICAIARDEGKAVRIGVNGGSLDTELIDEEMARGDGSAEEILDRCMVLSATRCVELALAAGMQKSQIILSCKVSDPSRLVAVYRELARRTDQPLHMGLTEAGMA